MQSRRSAGAVMFLVGLFVLQSMSQLLINESDEVEIINELNQIERVHFELRDGVYHDALGVYHSTLIAEIRALEADTIIGTFDEFGLELSRPVSAEWLQPR